LYLRPQITTYASDNLDLRALIRAKELLISEIYENPSFTTKY